MSDSDSWITVVIHELKLINRVQEGMSCDINALMYVQINKVDKFYPHVDWKNSSRDYNLHSVNKNVSQLCHYIQIFEPSIQNAFKFHKLTIIGLF